MTSVKERATAALRSTEWINDDVLLYLLRDVLARAFDGGSAAHVIDPVLLTLLIDSPALAGGPRKKSLEATLRQCAAEFEAALRADALLLLPLHCAGHWSLLAYRPAWRQWFVCDSMGAYHRARAEAALEALDRLGLVPAQQGEQETRVLWYNDMPRQPQSYECARYVLFYAFVLLRNHCDAAARDSAPEFQTRLERELPHVCETHRPGFEAHLLRMLGQ